jgi:hypothetical protein
MNTISDSVYRVPIYRILIDTSAESFINEQCVKYGFPFRFVNEDDDTSFIMVDLAGLILFSAGIVSVHGTQLQPVHSENHHNDHIVDFRGIVKN